MLAELGFRYDSSVFPVKHDTYGVPSAPRGPFRVETPFGPILEFPMATFRWSGGPNFPVGGGGYLRLLPYWYTKAGVARAWREGLPVVSYVHPWELDPGTAATTGSAEIDGSGTIRTCAIRKLDCAGFWLWRVFQLSRQWAGRVRARVFVKGSDLRMKQDNMPQVARFWNTIAAEFDAIYTGDNKSGSAGSWTDFSAKTSTSGSTG